MMFRPVPGFPNYQINRAGQVWSLKRKRFVKEKPKGFKPYPRIILYKDGTRYHFWIHRLNAEVWHGSVKGKHVHHKDEDTYNYHERNLVILTPEQHVIITNKLRARRARRLSRALKNECPF